MSKVFTAKYAGCCGGCRNAINPGDRVRFNGRRSLWHAQCVPSYRSLPRRAATADDMEYARGVAEAETIKYVRAIYGEEAAVAEEIAQDMRAGDW